MTHRIRVLLKHGLTKYRCSLWKSWLLGAPTWTLVASTLERGNSWNHTLGWSARVPKRAASEVWPEKTWKEKQSFTRIPAQRYEPVVICSLQDGLIYIPLHFQLGGTHTAACELCEKDFPHVSDLKDHLTSSCPEKIVPCKQADNGCTWRGQRASLETHVNQCAYESIKGFFAIHGAQVTQLSKDNERLRRRTDELEGTVRILRQELEWVKIALGPWCRPIYPERPSVSINYTQYHNDDDTSTASVPGPVGSMHSRGVGPTGGTSHPEPRAENGATEGFDLVDPFSSSSRRRNQVPGVYATNTASTTTGVVNADSNTNSSSADAVESHNGHDPNREASYNATGTALSPGASDLQWTFTAPPAALLSDYFPSEDWEEFEEGGLSSQSQGWQHVSSPANQMTPNPNLSIHSPVSISDLVPQTGRRSRMVR